MMNEYEEKILITYGIRKRIRGLVRSFSEAGLSASDFAAMCGTDLVSLGGYMADEDIPSLGVYLRMCAVLGWDTTDDPNYLYTIAPGLTDMLQWEMDEVEASLGTEPSEDRRKASDFREVIQHPYNFTCEQWGRMFQWVRQHQPRISGE